MKYLLTFLIVLSGHFIWSQSSAIHYQTLIKDDEGIAVNNQLITLKAQIRQLAADGPILFSETHVKQTGPDGELTIEIGNGNDQTIEFSAIDWSKPNFIELQLKLDDETDYVHFEVNEMLTVPYALFAFNAECVPTCTPYQGQDGVQGPPGPTGPTGAAGPPGPAGNSTWGPGVSNAGAQGASGLSFLRAMSQEPGNPVLGLFYVDDGTNREDEQMGLRYYDGTNWIDI